MFIISSFRKLQRIHYSCINSIVPHQRSRWALTTAIVIAYTFTTEDIWEDLNTYLVGFYLLMLTLSYFLPRGVRPDPYQGPEQEHHPFSFSEQTMTSFENINQLQHSTDKPLLRQLNQIQIWQRSTVAIALGVACSYFKMLQIDVFWPLLLFYFICLTLYTILKVLRTMRRYGYDLSDFQKQPSLI